MVIGRDFSNQKLVVSAIEEAIITLSPKPPWLWWSSPLSTSSQFWPSSFQMWFTTWWLLPEGWQNFPVRSTRTIQKIEQSSSFGFIINLWSHFTRKKMIIMVMKIWHMLKRPLNQLKHLTRVYIKRADLGIEYFNENSFHIFNDLKFCIKKGFGH